MPGIDPEGRRLPIKLDSTSNGEFAPVPLWPANLEANRLAHEAAAENSKRLGCSKRTFLTSACGAASTLLAFNAANAAAGRTGGFFDLPTEAALDLQLARAQVGPAKQEFILDVQGHFIDTPKGNPKSAEVFLKDVFIDSDTDMMVLSFVPSARDAEPLTIQAADEVRRLVDKLEGTHRLLLHGRVNPNQPGDLEAMDELHRSGASARGRPTRSRVRTAKASSCTTTSACASSRKRAPSASRTSASTRDCPSASRSYEHSQCSDIGVVAKRFPDVNFLIYHSGFVSTVTEKAYDASGKERRHRHAHRFAAQATGQAEQQRVCRAGQHLALPDARPRAGGARAGQADQVVRREQRAVGHRLDLVRLAAGPDPGVPHFPDLRETARTARLSRDHSGAARKGLRPERRERVRSQRRQK